LGFYFMKLKVSVLFALAFLLSQISFAQTTVVRNIPLAPSTTAQADGKRGYLIGPGDVLMITVVGEKDLEVSAVTVDEDGKIEVPFSKEPVSAKCRTEKELRVDIAKLLNAYGLRNPQAAVYVKERNSRPPVTLFGEVKSPQRIILTRKATLQDLLAFSGGATEKASGMIQITRTQPVLCAEDEDDDWKTFSNDGTNFPSKLYSSNSLKEVNPTIHPGDIIDVLKAPPVYIIGEVIRPSEVVMPEGGLPLMQAIAMASGTTRQAKIKEVKVYRRKQDSVQSEVIVVDYAAIKKGKQKDIMLEPLDIVEIGKSKKSVWDVAFEIATGTARQAATNAVVF
jgi:polysaccharide export outer membrane protein